MRALVITLCLLVTSTSCTTLQQLIGLTLNPPTVKLEDAHLKKVNFEEITVELVLDIHNRNSVDLAFRNLKYEAKMFDIKLTEGLFEDKITALADAHTKFTVPLTIPTSQAGQVAQKLLMGGLDNAVLFLEAEAAFITDAGDIVVDFSDEKKLVNK